MAGGRSRERRVDHDADVGFLDWTSRNDGAPWTGALLHGELAGLPEGCMRRTGAVLRGGGTPWLETRDAIAPWREFDDLCFSTAWARAYGRCDRSENLIPLRLGQSDENREWPRLAVLNPEHPHLVGLSPQIDEDDAEGTCRNIRWYSFILVLRSGYPAFPNSALPNNVDPQTRQGCVKLRRVHGVSCLCGHCESDLTAQRPDILSDDVWHGFFYCSQGWLESSLKLLQRRRDILRCRTRTNIRAIF